MGTTDNSRHHNQANQQKSRESKPINDYVRYSGLAFQMIAMILIGLWLGKKVDLWLEMERPIFTLVGILLAIVGSLAGLIKNLPKS